MVEALAPSAERGEAAAGGANGWRRRKPDLVADGLHELHADHQGLGEGPVGVPALLAITATGRVLREMLD